VSALAAGMQRVWRLRSVLAAGRSRFPVVSALVMLLFVLAAVLAPWIAPYAPADADFIDAMMPPAWVEGGSLTHLLGTDQLGRDLLSRIVYGARLTLIVSVIGIAGAGAIGVIAGLAAGYIGGLVDALIMRVVDAFLALPFILMALAFVAALGVSVTNLVLVMALTNWARYARLVRGETLKVREADFIALARVAGMRRWRIAVVHILPNIANSVIVLATIDVGRVIILESSLSFLGLGIQPPAISWGLMLADGQQYLTVAWWLGVLPGLAILLTVLSSNLLGDWLRDRLDPRTAMD